MQEKIDALMYHELLMDHYRHPRHAGHLDHPDFSSGQVNPSCGDSVKFEGMIEHDTITDIAFSGSGCVISQATSSMVSEYVLGKTIDEVLALHKEDIVRLIGVQLGPIRLKCALLALQALHQGLLDYRNCRRIQCSIEQK